MLRPRDYHLRVGVLDLKQRGDLPLEGLIRADVIAHLDVGLLALPDGDEVNLLLVERTDIHLIATPEQLNGHDVLVGPSPIHVPCAQQRVFEGMISQVVLLAGCEVLLPTDVVAPDPVEGKRVAQVANIGADGLVVGNGAAAPKSIRDAPCRRDVGNVVQHEVAYLVQHHLVANVMPLHDVAHDEGTKHIRDVLEALHRVLVKV